MRFIKRSSKSLSFTLVTIIFLCVSSILTVDAVLRYKEVRSKTIHRMQQEVSTSLSELQQNLASLIESYSINEYEKLIKTEVEKRAFHAIVIEDLNMGKVIGEAIYKSGQIRGSNDSIHDIDSVDEQTLQSLYDCCYVARERILSSLGQHIGTVSIYHSYHALNRALAGIIESAVLKVLSLAFLLSGVLFFFIRFFV